MTAWTDNRQKSAPRKRPVPKMPEGYYSGDRPNPNLRAFVEAHLRERPYDPETDKYDVPAFDHPIETTKATAIDRRPAATFITKNYCTHVDEQSLLLDRIYSS